MRKIKILDFGKQGMMAAKHIVESDNIEKCYIDNNKIDFEELDIPHSNRILVNFNYEINNFENLLTLNQTFKKNNVLRVMDSFIEDNSSLLVIFLFGIGGKMSLLAREILKFYEQKSLPVPILALTTLPLKYEIRNYTCNVLSKRMLSFFQNCKNIGYSFIDMNIILKKLEGNIFKTLNESNYWISNIMNELIRWINAYEDWHNEKPDEFSSFMKSIFRGLVYFSIYESTKEDIASAKELKKNSIHAYQPNPQSENIIFTLETKGGLVYDGYEFCSELTELFPNREENMKGLMLYKEDLDVCYRSFFVSSGSISKEHCNRRDFY